MSGCRTKFASTCFILLLLLANTVPGQDDKDTRLRVGRIESTLNGARDAKGKIIKKGLVSEFNDLKGTVKDEEKGVEPRLEHIEDAVKDPKQGLVPRTGIL